MEKIIPPTLQQMRLFEAVARLGSITRAAEEVHLTQPSVSMQIKALEDKIGLPLTDRVGKAVQLTGAGQEVAAASRDVLQRVTEMRARLAAMRDDAAGPMSIAVVSTARYFLPQLLGEFKRFHPKVEPRLQIANRETILARIEERADDLYILGHADWDDAMVAEPFLENVIVFVARPDHPLVGQRHIPLAQIARESVIQREPGSGTRKAVDRLCDAAEVKLQTYMEFDDAEAIKQGVISGLGIAYLSLPALRLELAAGEIAILDVQGFPLKRGWYVVHGRGTPLTIAAQTFLEFLRNSQQGPGL